MAPTVTAELLRKTPEAISFPEEDLFSALFSAFRPTLANERLKMLATLSFQLDYATPLSFNVQVENFLRKFRRITSALSLPEGLLARKFPKLIRGTLGLHTNQELQVASFADFTPEELADPLERIPLPHALTAPVAPPPPVDKFEIFMDRFMRCIAPAAAEVVAEGGRSGVSPAPGASGETRDPSGLSPSEPTAAPFSLLAPLRDRFAGAKAVGDSGAHSTVPRTPMDFSSGLPPPSAELHLPPVQSAPSAWLMADGEDGSESELGGRARRRPPPNPRGFPPPAVTAPATTMGLAAQQLPPPPADTRLGPRPPRPAGPEEQLASPPRAASPPLPPSPLRPTSSQNPADADDRDLATDDEDGSFHAPRVSRLRLCFAVVRRLAATLEVARAFLPGQRSSMAGPRGPHAHSHSFAVPPRAFQPAQERAPYTGSRPPKLSPEHHAAYKAAGYCTRCRWKRHPVPRCRGYDQERADDLNDDPLSTPLLHPLPGPVHNSPGSVILRADQQTPVPLPRQTPRNRPPLLGAAPTAPASTASTASTAPAAAPSGRQLRQNPKQTDRFTPPYQGRGGRRGGRGGWGGRGGRGGRGRSQGQFFFAQDPMDTLPPDAAPDETF